MKLWRRLAARAVARVPNNALRILGYRALGCSIGKGVRIGPGTLVSADRCVLEDGVILGRDCLVACGRFHVGRNSRILDGNTFIGQGTVRLGSEVRIISHHYFDVWHDVTIGEHTWIAGRGSQFWTHGTTRDTTDQSIHIGNGAYIGSAVLFAPGSGVANGALVGMGSVVTSRFSAPDCFIAGNPARVIRTDVRWRDEWA